MNRSTAPAPDAAPMSYTHATAYVLCGTMSKILIMFGVGVATARIWGADGRGLLAAIMIWPAMVAIFFESGAIQSIPVIFGQAPDRRDELSGTVMFLLLISSTLGCAIVLIVFALGVVPNMPWWWGVMAAIQIPLGLCVAYAKGIALSVQKIKFLSHLIWVREPIILIVILTGGLLLAMDDPKTDPWVYILAMNLSMCCGVIVSLRMWSSHMSIRPRFNIIDAMTLARKTVAFRLNTIAMKMNYKVDILILAIVAMKVPRADLANYTVGVAITEILWLMPQAMGLVVLSKGAAANRQADFVVTAANMARRLTLLAIVPAIAIALLAPLLLPWVYGPDFSKAGTVVQCLMPGVILFFAARTFEATLVALDRPWRVIAVMAPCAAVNVILNFLLIPRWGIYAAAIVSTATYTVGSLVLCIVFARTVKLPLRQVIVPTGGDVTFVINKIRRLIRL